MSSAQRVEAKSWADRLTDMMEKIAPWLEQRHLASVRDGIAALMPLFILGGLILLILQFPVEAVTNALAPYAEIVWVPWNMTFLLVSVFLSMAVAYNLARRYDMEPLMPTLVALLTFWTIASPITGEWGEGGIPGTYFDNSGLFTAIIVGLLSVEVYRFFVERRMVITMPPGVPPAIVQGFIAVVPMTVLLFVAWLLRCALGIDIAGGVVAAFSKLVAASDAYIAVALAETLHGFLWTLGIHGDNTIAVVLSPLWTTHLMENSEALLKGISPLPWIYTSEFRSYVVPGGSGATLPLAIYMIRSKSERLRRVGWLGIWPGIFNINEPITFGTPVIFNPIMAIPFIVITFLNATVAYFASYFNLVTRTCLTSAWTLPSPILMYLESNYDIRAAILAIITEFVLPGIIWWPFFKAWERITLEKEGV